ncbi:hypothetical protein O3M35_007655 [Rhynocoris fuscipes]|uniref:Malate dehydrogenase, mitochondrial n=1 Tax=Rhynocoris fuscipes TaxID=488301 RepID=A0AAW1DA49_9HEMI
MDMAQCILNKKTVSILGSNSNFGRLLSLLLKQSPAIKQLCLYDENSMSTACDVANINTPCKIRAFQGRDQLPCALKNADVVLIADRINFVCNKNEILLDEGAPRIIDYGNAIAESCSQAIILVAATPVNTLLPLLSTVLVHHNVYDCNKVFGITAADNIRANAVFAQHLKCDPKNIVLPVVGGSSPDTRVPIFSQARPKCKLSKKAMKKITKLVKYSDMEVYKRKGELESVNKAYATSRFIHSVLAGLRGEPNIAEIALTRSTFVPGTSYFALPLILGPTGAKYRFCLPELNRFEEKNLSHAVIELNRDCKRGEKYFTLEETMGKGSDVIDSKNRGIMVGELLDHMRTNSDKANVEYSLMTNKPQIKVPLHQTPSKVPIPSTPLEPFPHCYDGCSPLDLPVPPACKRSLPPNPSGTCCKTEEKPSTPAPPYKSIGGCKVNPQCSPLTGGNPPPCGANNVPCGSGVTNCLSPGQAQNTCSNAQNESSQAYKSSSTQNIQHTEPKNADDHIIGNRYESSQPVSNKNPPVSSTPQTSPSKASSKMEFSDSTERNFSSKINTTETNALKSSRKVKSSHPPIELSSSITSTEQERVESKDKPVYHPIMFELTNRKDKAIIGNQKDENQLIMSFPNKNVSLISENLDLMKSKVKTTLAESKNLKNDKEIALSSSENNNIRALKAYEQKAKDDKIITGKKSSYDVKNIYNIPAGRKSIKEIPIVLKNESNIKKIFEKYISSKDESPEVENNSKAKTDPSMNAVTSMDKQILINFLQKELKNDKFASCISKDDLNADNLRDVLNNKLNLLKSLERDLKKDKSSTDNIQVENMADSKADNIKDVLNNKLDSLISLESDLQKDKSPPTDSMKQERSSVSKLDQLADKQSRIKEKLLKTLAEELKKIKSIKEEKNTSSNNIAVKNYVPKLEENFPKSLQSKLDKDNKKEIKRIEPLKKENTKSSLDFIKSFLVSKMNFELNKNVKKANQKITFDYSKIKKDTEKIDENYMAESYIPYRTYAPKCPPQYLLGEYIPHKDINEDNINFDNVLETQELKPYNSKFYQFKPSEQRTKYFDDQNNRMKDKNIMENNISYKPRKENPNFMKGSLFSGRSYKPDTSIRDPNIKKYNITQNYQVLSGFNSNKDKVEDSAKTVTQFDRTQNFEKGKTTSIYDQTTTINEKYNIAGKQEEEIPNFVKSSLSSDSFKSFVYYDGPTPDNRMRDPNVKKYKINQEDEEGRIKKEDEIEESETSQNITTRYPLTSPNKGDPKYSTHYYNPKPYSRN